MKNSILRTRLQEVFNVAHQEFLDRRAREDKDQQTIRMLVELIEKLRTCNGVPFSAKLHAMVELDSLKKEGRI